MNIIKHLSDQNSNLAERLTEIAYERTSAFCYHCCTKAVHTEHGNRCPKCFSDDLARFLDGFGVGWGIDWVVDNIVSDNVDDVDFDDYFEEYVSETYGDCQIGWLNYDVASAIKALDPASWGIAMQEFADSLVSDGQLIIADDGKYFWVADIADASR